MSGVHVYTVTEAAALLRMSRSRLYQLVHDGDVPHRRIYGQVRFTDADLEQILADAHRPAVTRRAPARTQTTVPRLASI